MTTNEKDSIKKALLANRKSNSENGVDPDIVCVTVYPHKGQYISIAAFGDTLGNDAQLDAIDPSEEMAADKVLAKLASLFDLESEGAQYESSWQDGDNYFGLIKGDIK